MKPDQTAGQYDRIATWWRERHAKSDYGVESLKRAVWFCKNKNLVVDAGFVSGGEFRGIHQEHGFAIRHMEYDHGPAGKHV